jgi:uncharacterized protein (DUF697 family)
MSTTLTSVDAVNAVELDADTRTGDEKADRQRRAQKMIQGHAAAAAGIGLVPVPLFDQISVAAICGKLIYELGQLYAIPVSRYKVKATVAAVLGGAHTQWITFFTMGVITWVIPGVGFLGTLAVRPALAGAITYALGKVFARQFEAGRNLDNFNVDAARREFQRGFEEGKVFMRQQLNNHSA